MLHAAHVVTLRADDESTLRFLWLLSFADIRRAALDGLKGYCIDYIGEMVGKRVRVFMRSVRWWCLSSL